MSRTADRLSWRTALGRLSPAARLYLLAGYGTVAATVAGAYFLRDVHFPEAARRGAFGWPSALAWTGVRFGSWLLLAPAIHAVVRRVWRRPTAVATAAVAFAGALLCSLHGAIDATARLLFSPTLPAADSAWALLRQEWGKSIPVDLLIYFGLLGAFAFIEARGLAREQAARAEALRESNALLKYEVLRSKVAPHFLFNALQSIAALIPKDGARAAELVLDLSDVLRYALSTGEQLTPLRKEVATVRAYLTVEEARFGERLSYRIDIDPDALPHPVPAMILQPLVENAVRHGLGPKHGPGHIELIGRVADGELVLRVRDDGVGPSGAAPHGIGLTAVGQRLASLYGDRASLALDRVDAWTVATVRIRSGA